MPGLGFFTLGREVAISSLGLPYSVGIGEYVPQGGVG